MDLITLALAKKYTNKKFESAVGFQGFKVVTELPTTNIATASIYLLKLPYAQSGNLYEEYVYVDGAWESLGSTVDLEGYVTEETLNEALKNINWNDIEDKPFYEYYGAVGNLIRTETVTSLENGRGTSRNDWQQGLGIEFSGDHCFIEVEGEMLYCSFKRTTTTDPISYTTTQKIEFINSDGIIIAYYELPIDSGQSYGTRYFSISILPITDFGTQHTVNIYDAVLTSKPIDDKFISDMIARISDVEALESKHDEDIIKANEAHEALQEQINNLGTPTVSWNDLEDKPFYTTLVPGESIFAQDCSFINQDNHGQQIDFIYAHRSFVGQALAGNYYVTIDGKTTFCTSTFDPNLITIISNGMNGGWVLKDPDGVVIAAVQRQISTSGSTQYDWIFYYDKLGTYFVNIQKETLQYSCIDDNFISANIARTASLNALATKIDNLPRLTWDNLENKPFYETMVPGDSIWSITNLEPYDGYWSIGMSSNGHADAPVRISTPTNGEKYYIVKDNVAQIAICKEEVSWDYGPELDVYTFTYELTGKNVGIMLSYMRGTNTPYWEKIDTNYSLDVVKICQIATSIQYLDNKFLSDTIARITDIEALEAKHDADIVKANEAHAELDNKIKNLSWDELDNKPFGESIEKGELVSTKKTLTFHSNTTTLYDRETILNGSHPGESGIINGKQYLMSFGEIEEIAVANITTNGLEAPSEIETVTLTGLTTGAYIKQDYYWMASATAEIYYPGWEKNPTVEIAVYEVTTEFKAIDEKYIPDTIARTSDIPTVEELVAAVIAALPAAEEVEI